MPIQQKALSLNEFLDLPEADVNYELTGGQAIPKMSPKRLHAKLTGVLFLILHPWSEGRGEVGIEWAVTLKRRGEDWVPVPDLLYLSYERLQVEGDWDGPCPVPPELVIEIISPGQSYTDIIQKAVDYLETGVSNVWVVNTQAREITVFNTNQLPRTHCGDDPITSRDLPGLQISPNRVFQSAGLV